MDRPNCLPGDKNLLGDILFLARKSVLIDLYVRTGENYAQHLKPSKRRIVGDRGVSI